MNLLQLCQKKYESYHFFQQKIIYSVYAGTIFVALYTLVGKFFFGTPRFLPLTWVDNNTPFLLWTFWIYISDYPFLFLAGMLCPTKKSFDEFKKSFWLVVFIHITIFFFFPTEIARPTIIEPGLSGMIGRYIHVVDGTVNCFPSLHVSLTLLSCFVISKNNAHLSILAFVWGLAIIASTLTTKQHYFYDVIGGTVVALVVFFSCHYFLNYGKKHDNLVALEN